MKTRRSVIKSLLLAPLAAALAGCGRSDGDPNTIHLVIASSHSTNLAWIGTMQQLVVPETNKRLEARGSPYRIRWTQTYGGSLYKYEHTLEAIEIGLTDMGWVGTLWELSKMPLQNITYFTPFSSEDYYAIFDVYNEMHHTLPAMRDAWTVQNQRFLGANALDSYHLMTNFPVRSLEDIRGRKILAPGPAAAWLEGTGAVAVDGGLTTYYTQLQTGVADGVLTILTGAPAYAIHEVAPYITLVGLGGQVSGSLSINLDTWKRLPEDVQEVLTELGPEYSRGVADELKRRYEEGLARMRNEGATITPLPVEEKLKWLAAMPDIATRWVEATEARGYPAGEVLRAYMQGIRARGGEPLRDWDKPD
jgi:TRAP-type C4-dicarboxylate transport system substrate-binding protein